MGSSNSASARTQVPFAREFIPGGSNEEPASSSNSASAQAQMGASLNPFAPEFIPGGSIIEPPAPSSNSASAQAQMGASLNPSAREFIARTPIPPPTDEGFVARAEREELATAVEPSFLDNSSPLDVGSETHKVRPSNKELYLQAKFRFLVSDFGDYWLNLRDPDKMPQWEDIAAVNIFAPDPIQCPICLETPPVCPQITSCGHIFCFPCILRYLVLGDDEQRDEHFKKCPLCLAMTSSKTLRTVFVDSVHNHQVGDIIGLTLLNRAKGSIIPFEKSEGVAGALPHSKVGQCHSFSKFTLTSDADQTTNKAITELSSWAERAQNAAGEDMDLIPFALLAIDQLQQRKLAWNEHRASEFLSSSPPVRQRIMAQTKESATNSLSQGLKSSASENDNIEGTKWVPQRKQRGEKVDVAAETEAAMADLKVKAGWVYESAFSDDEGVGLSKTRSCKVKHDAIEPAQPTTPVNIPSNWEENAYEKANSLEVVEGSSDLNKDTQQVAKKEDEDNECYAFFQCADGQPLIMHPLNMKCLLQHCGSYEKLPSRLQVRILEMEGQIQTEALRKRYRYLSHLPLTTNFWFCEVDLRGVLPGSAFTPFIDELRYRETRRRRRQKQEQAERSREERMSAVQSRNSPPADFLPFIEDNGEEKQPFNSGCDESSLDSSPGPADQRKLFSQVTRLGFASAHDAPYLTPAKIVESSQEKASSSTGAGGKLSTMSFADIIQAQPLKTAPTARNGTDGSSQSSSKKNKKASKVLLSTAGGRRY